MRSPIATTTIGPDLMIKGRLRKCREIDIHGLVEGGIEAGEVRVHKGGLVLGQIRAQAMEVHGTVKGDVSVKNLIRIGGTGNVTGNIRYGQLVLDPGGELSADVRNVPPEVYGDFQVAVRRGRWVPITQSDLDAVDPDDTSENIRIAVSAVSGGYLALEEAPSVAIEAFTDADIEAGRVLFVHDGQSASGGFDVLVSDKSGGVAPPQRVTVSVIA